MSPLQELRKRVQSMDSTDCRQELVETLDLLAELESDFEAVLKVVGKITTKGNRAHLADIAERRGVKFWK